MSLQLEIQSHQPVREQRPAPIRRSGEAPEEAPPGGSFARVKRRSACMERLLTQVRSAAPHLRIGTLEGEAGTGKSLIAEQLRLNGPFRTGPLIHVRASDVRASDLNESNGAGTAGDWSSLCGRAAHGMLLLEEVEKLSPLGQKTILDYLDQCAHSPGRAEPMQLLVTSSRSLRSLVIAGTFSRDLAFRLTAMRFVVPPLRERREDVSLLGEHFVTVFAARYGKAIRGLDPGALARLLNHDWPGNVRELESVIEAACLEVEVQWIRPIDLRLIPGAPAASPAASALKPAEDLTLDGAIQRHIAEILTRTRGNKLRTARLLGISRSTLYRMLQPAEAL